MNARHSGPFINSTPELGCAAFQGWIQLFSFFDWPYELPEEGLIKNTRLSPHTGLDFFTQLSPHGVCEGDSTELIFHGTMKGYAFGE
jgi:hypothetical protein